MNRHTKFFFADDVRQACDGKGLVKFPLAHAALHVPLVNLNKVPSCQ